MDSNEWLVKNGSRFGSEYELLFAKTVLPLVPELSFDAVSAQYPFQDSDRRQRYCDFVIHENDDVRIAIEIDGYDKHGRGCGMSQPEFIDWQRRQTALTSIGWYVLRFANLDVRDDPKRCAEHVSLLLKYSRAKSRHHDLSVEEKARLDVLTRAQNNTIEHLDKETSVMKYTVFSFTALILVLVMVIVWQNRSVPPNPPAGTVESYVPKPQPQRQSSAPKPRPQRQISIPKPQPERQSSAPKPQPAAHILEGATCDNPISWQVAGQHLDQTAAVVGPLMKITQRENIRGDPTWIDIGGTFPNPQRMMLIIWGDQKSEFPMVMPGVLEGKNVCVVGRIKSYKGIPEIELRTASQFKVLAGE